MAVGTGKRHPIKFKDRIIIVDWLRKNKADLMIQRPAWPDLAKRIEQETRIEECSPRGLRATAKAIGVFWNTPRTSISGRKNPIVRLKQVTAILRIIVDDLIQFRGECGAHVSPILSDIQDLLSHIEENGKEEENGKVAKET